MLHLRNLPNPDIQISPYKFEWARGGEARRAEAVARHQGRAKVGWKQIWAQFLG